MLFTPKITRESATDATGMIQSSQRAGGVPAGNQSQQLETHFFCPKNGASLVLEHVFIWFNQDNLREDKIIDELPSGNQTWRATAKSPR